MGLAGGRGSNRQESPHHGPPELVPSLRSRSALATCVGKQAAGFSRAGGTRPCHPCALPVSTACSRLGVRLVSGAAERSAVRVHTALISGPFAPRSLARAPCAAGGPVSSPFCAWRRQRVLAAPCHPFLNVPEQSP